MESNSTPARAGRPVGTGATPSDAVKRIRAAAKLTQMEMALRIGVAESTLQRLEKLGKLPTGRASMQLLEQLAKEAGEAI